MMDQWYFISEFPKSSKSSYCRMTSYYIHFWGKWVVESTFKKMFQVLKETFLDSESKLTEIKLVKIYIKVKIFEEIFKLLEILKTKQCGRNVNFERKKFKKLDNWLWSLWIAKLIETEFIARNYVYFSRVCFLFFKEFIARDFLNNNKLNL